jgi:hypothetical protein
MTATLDGVSAASPGQAPRVALVSSAGGVFSLAGIPERAFPDLATTSYTVELSVGADGYLATPLSVVVPAGTTVFPLPLLTAELRRPALRLRGRVTDNAPIPAGVAGAGVEILDPSNLIGFQAPFAFMHATGTNLMEIPLSPTGPALPLLADVDPGSSRLALARRTGLAPGEIVQLGSGVEREYAIVDGLEGPTTLDRPGVALLRAPLAYRHRVADGPVERVVPGAPGASTLLTRDAFPGDQVAFAGSPWTLASDQTVLVDDPDPDAREYLVAFLPGANTDADGYYRLGPIGRTAAVTLRVTPPASPSFVDVTHIVVYGQANNVVNVRV